MGSTYSAEATIIWFAETAMPPHNELSGGVRIKEIIKNDSVGNVTLSKKFRYRISGTTKSSGVNVYPPSYIQYRDQTIIKQGNTCSSLYCQLIEQSSTSFSPLTFANGAFVNYSEVSDYVTDSSQNGYTNNVYNVTSSGFNTGIPSFPFAPRLSNDWMNGNLLQSTDFALINAQYRKIRRVINYYNYDAFDTAVKYQAYAVKIGVYTPPYVCYYPCTLTNPPPAYSYYGDMAYGIQYYKLSTSWIRLEKNSEITYTSLGDSLVTTSNYFYDNAASIQANRIQTLNSREDTIIQKIKFPKDYSSYGFISNLLSKNVLTPPIERYSVRKTSGGSQYVLNGQITTFSTSSVLPNKIYNYETPVPVSIGSFTASSMNSSGVFSMDNLYKEKAFLNGYDSLGNIRQLQKSSDIRISYIWDYIDSKPIAECVNADTSSIAYTSFEANSKGGWLFSGSTSSDVTSITGAKCYSASGGNITKTGLTSATYIVSYWGKSGSVTVNSSGPTRTGRSVGLWTYYEHEITGTSITVSGSSYIDELRLYPKGALMSTYTYTPLVGMTTQCDANNRITYYQYDEFNRLFLILDQDRNIVKRICYNYSGQNESCKVYYNSLRTQSFTRNDCSTGYHGSAVIDTVLAGIYSSLTSQAQADSLAQAAINANGQANANSKGTCILNLCNSGNCSGVDKKCINDTCRTAVKFYTAAVFNHGHWNCTYHWHWVEDCSDSIDYTETLGSAPTLELGTCLVFFKRKYFFA